ncbi:hypothetical protein Bca4012_025967 [Brassica carinata]
MSLANTNVELPDSMGEVCDIRATYDDHTQTAQQVMVNIRVDKDAIVCVSVFDSLDERLHKRLEADVVQSRSWNRILSSYAKPILVQLKLPMDGITSPVLMLGAYEEGNNRTSWPLPPHQPFNSPATTIFVLNKTLTSNSNSKSKSSLCQQ